MDLLTWFYMSSLIFRIRSKFRCTFLVAYFVKNDNPRTEKLAVNLETRVVQKVYRRGAAVNKQETQEKGVGC
jgi:hypothetical protein